MKLELVIDRVGEDEAPGVRGPKVPSVAARSVPPGEMATTVPGTPEKPSLAIVIMEVDDPPATILLGVACVALT